MNGWLEKEGKIHPDDHHIFEPMMRDCFQLGDLGFGGSIEIICNVNKLTERWSFINDGLINDVSFKEGLPKITQRDGKPFFTPIYKE